MFYEQQEFRIGISWSDFDVDRGVSLFYHELVINHLFIPFNLRHHISGFRKRFSLRVIGSFARNNNTEALCGISDIQNVKTFVKHQKLQCLRI